MRSGIPCYSLAAPIAAADEHRCEEHTPTAAAAVLSVMAERNQGGATRGKKEREGKGEWRKEEE
jgi:hypothetical protein